jgi:hypothetical protein
MTTTKGTIYLIPIPIASPEDRPGMDRWRWVVDPRNPANRVISADNLLDAWGFGYQVEIGRYFDLLREKAKSYGYAVHFAPVD